MSESANKSANKSADNRLQLVELGRFGRPHGIKGWLKVNSFTTPIDNLCSYEQLSAEIGGSWIPLVMDQYRTQGKGLVVHIEGYDDPETARQLTGKGIWVERDALPALAANEFYWHQLQGLQVINQHEQVFGEVTELMETGANDVLVVDPTEGSIDDRQRLIPYLYGSVVQQVSVEAGLIRVNWEADYLE